VVPVSWMTVFLDFPARLFGPGAAFWQALTATTVSPPRGRAGEFATLIPSRGDACLRVQATGSAAAGCHLDLHTADVTGGARAARELGARLVRAEDGLATLRSPGGLGFCLVRDEGAGRRPEPEAWPGGHRSLVDQLSIDVPPEDYAGECAFWSALTGWPRVRSSRLPRPMNRRRVNRRRTISSRRKRALLQEKTLRLSRRKPRRWWQRCRAR